MTIAHRSLRELFQDIAEAATVDPVRHLVALTYEFDDQQLINLLTQRALDEAWEPRGFDLRQIARIAPVVIYDARNTRDGQLTPHFLELLAVHMPAYSCHHPKAVLVALGRAIHLVLGSMNLTRTGLFSNREVALHWRFDADTTADMPLLTELLTLLRTGHADVKSKPLKAALDAMQAQAHAWSEATRADGRQPTQRHHLIASGYGEPKPAIAGLDQLVSLWSRGGGKALREVLAVSPFFDLPSANATLAETLDTRLGVPERFTLITDETVVPQIMRRHLGGCGEPVLRVIPETISHAERARIARANDRVVDRPPFADLSLTRRLHAKLLALHDGDRTLVYAGSANLTRKAWLGANRELGVAWWHDGPWEKLVSDVAAGLSGGAANLAARLTSTPPEPASADEDYAELPGYPDFVHGVTLARNDDGALRFTVHADSPSALGKLADFDVNWAGEALRFDAQGLSQPLDEALVYARLLGGRHLRFSPRGQPDAVYWQPFRHDSALWAEREQHLYASAMDWLGDVLGLDRPLPADPNEADVDAELPPDTTGADHDPNSAKPDSAAAERATNPTVRMQAYLSLFARAERELLRRADQIGALPAVEREAAWQRQVATPLQTGARLVARDAADTPAARVFKLGELMLLAKAAATRAGGQTVPNLQDASLPALSPPLQEWLVQVTAEST